MLTDSLKARLPLLSSSATLRYKIQQMVPSLHTLLQGAATQTERLVVTIAATVLPRDAMHKRGLCRHAVSVRLSVRQLVDSVETNKYTLKLFHRRVATPF